MKRQRPSRVACDRFAFTVTTLVWSQFVLMPAGNTASDACDSASANDGSSVAPATATLEVWRNLRRVKSSLAFEFWAVSPLHEYHSSKNGISRMDSD